jgi:hypothetical protein
MNAMRILWHTLKWGIILPNLPPLGRRFRYNKLRNDESDESGSDADPP